MAYVPNTIINAENGDVEKYFEAVQKLDSNAELDKKQYCIKMKISGPKDIIKLSEVVGHEIVITHATGVGNKIWLKILDN